MTETQVKAEPTPEAASRKLMIPSRTGLLEPVNVVDPLPRTPKGAASVDRSREFYAAPHVTVDPNSLSAENPGRVDWETTLRFRSHLWDQGLGVAEAMDTAQRGMGLPDDAIRELIKETSALARARKAPLVCGVGTPTSDSSTEACSLQAIAREYLDEASFVVENGAVPVLMASRALRRSASKWEEYVEVYETVLDRLDSPVFIHWLGPAFDPYLDGYWGTSNVDRAVDSLAGFITKHAQRIRGIKVSLLREDIEIRLRGMLPSDVHLFTGDDFNYPSLIIGDETGSSHALLGAFNPLARLAGVVLDELDAGETTEARRLLELSQPLAQEIFVSPTQYYKTGVTFMAWLNGHQDHFRMLERRESDRDVLHFSQVFRIAAENGLFENPDLAVLRMKSFLSVQGVN